MKSLPCRIACLALLLPALASAQLPPGISGAWYNPEQSGHGLSVEILDDDRALAFWYVYDPQGNPLHLYLDGRIEGRRIEATAYAPRGMRFGSFRKADLRMPIWGEVSLEFISCDQALLQWTSNWAGYGTGSSPVRRLTGIKGLDCELVDDAVTPALLDGSEIATPGYGSSPAFASIDENGELRVLTALVGTADSVPGPSFVGTPGWITRAKVSDSGGVELLRYSSIWSHGFSTAVTPTSVEGAFTPNGGSLGLRTANGFTYQLALVPSRQSFVAPLSPQAIEGRWNVHMTGQFIDHFAELVATADGSVCLRFVPGIVNEPCRLAGQATSLPGSEHFIAFELKDSAYPAQPPFTGRAWVQRGDGIERLVLVGDNGPTGFGLVGRR